jgi:hypothetical protein
MKEISLIKGISNGNSKIIFIDITQCIYFQYLLFKTKEGIKITLNFNVINILISPQI